MEFQNTLKPEWYTLVVHPQHEINVRDKLIALSKNPAYKEFILDAKAVTIKTPNKAGKITEKVNPDYKSYVFVKMVYDISNDTAYHAVKVEGVLHILGAPTHLTEIEVNNMLKIADSIE